MSEMTVAYRVDNYGKPCMYVVDERKAREEAALVPGGGGSWTPVPLAELVAGLNGLVPAVRNQSIAGPGR